MISREDYSDITWVLTEWGEFPATYSDNACKVISSKYFTKNEKSMFDMVSRVVGAIENAGQLSGYFDNIIEKNEFAKGLGYLLLHQHASFNSPVWFNLGVEENPQCSACFIQSVEDDMGDILDLAKKEGMLFKYGSGTGTNLSNLRGKGAPLSKGGHASGPIEFMKMYDAVAGTIKSGGKTRRSAKMVMLDDDHPDIKDFIWCKALEDRKAKKYIASGVDPTEAYGSVWFQNGNNSVRLSDDFMAMAADFPGEKEDKLLDDIAAACWECGDPGIQFINTINENNPCGGYGSISASNPCGEFVFLDETACNLASIKLSNYTTKNLAPIVKTLVTAMDIIVDLSGYPTEKIAHNSKKFRPLGLGYTNLGAYLMSKGMHYDSVEARKEAGRVTREMNEHAHTASLALGALLGHAWESPVGLRNAQLTLLAPTGTISFMMDCDSTGIEPVFAEKQVKILAGGGMMDIVPECVKNANPDIISTAIGKYAITPMAHLKMMKAVQKHLSGAISKTVNLPEYTEPEVIKKLIQFAWESSLKGVAFYRDGSKGIQPLTEKPSNPTAEKPSIPTPSPRQHMPTTRDSRTHKFTIGGVTGYVTVGLFTDDRPGEIFVNISKEGSTIGGLMDSWATCFSLCLQYGVPLQKLCDKFRGASFAPSGFTGGDDIKSATSLVDYIANWLDLNFCTGTMMALKVKTESLSGGVCPLCGGMMQQTGTCQTCTSCGETSGGCG